MDNNPNFLDLNQNSVPESSYQQFLRETTPPDKPINPFALELFGMNPADIEVDETYLPSDATPYDPRSDEVSIHRFDLWKGTRYMPVESKRPMDLRHRLYLDFRKRPLYSILVKGLPDQERPLSSLDLQEIRWLKTSLERKEGNLAKKQQELAFLESRPLSFEMVAERFKSKQDTPVEIARLFFRYAKARTKLQFWPLWANPELKKEIRTELGRRVIYKLSRGKTWDWPVFQEVISHQWTAVAGFNVHREAIQEFGWDPMKNFWHKRGVAGSFAGYVMLHVLAATAFVRPKTFSNMPILSAPYEHVEWETFRTQEEQGHPQQILPKAVRLEVTPQDVRVELHPTWSSYQDQNYQAYWGDSKANEFNEIILALQPRESRVPLTLAVVKSQNLDEHLDELPRKLASHEWLDRSREFAQAANTWDLNIRSHSVASLAQKTYRFHQLQPTPLVIPQAEWLDTWFSSPDRISHSSLEESTASLAKSAASSEESESIFFLSDEYDKIPGVNFLSMGFASQRHMGRYRYPDMDTDQIRFLWLRHFLFRIRNSRRAVQTRVGVSALLPRPKSAPPVSLQTPSSQDFTSTLIQWLALLGNNFDMAYNKIPLMNLDVLQTFQPQIEGPNFEEAIADHNEEQETINLPDEETTYLLDEEATNQINEQTTDGLEQDWSNLTPDSGFMASLVYDMDQLEEIMGSDLYVDIKEFLLKLETLIDEDKTRVELTQLFAERFNQVKTKPLANIARREKLKRLGLNPDFDLLPKEKKAIARLNEEPKVIEKPTKILRLVAKKRRLEAKVKALKKREPIREQIARAKVEKLIKKAQEQEEAEKEARMQAEKEAKMTPNERAQEQKKRAQAQIEQAQKAREEEVKLRKARKEERQMRKATMFEKAVRGLYESRLNDDYELALYQTIRDHLDGVKAQSPVPRFFRRPWDMHITNPKRHVKRVRLERKMMVDPHFQNRPLDEQQSILAYHVDKLGTDKQFLKEVREQIENAKQASDWKTDSNHDWKANLEAEAQNKLARELQKLEEEREKIAAQQLADTEDLIVTMQKADNKWNTWTKQEQKPAENAAEIAAERAAQEVEEMKLEQNQALERRITLELRQQVRAIQWRKWYADVVLGRLEKPSQFGELDAKSDLSKPSQLIVDNKLKGDYTLSQLTYFINLQPQPKIERTHRDQAEQLGKVELQNVTADEIKTKGEMKEEAEKVKTKETTDTNKPDQKDGKKDGKQEGEEDSESSGKTSKLKIKASKSAKLLPNGMKYMLRTNPHKNLTKFPEILTRNPVYTRYGAWSQRHMDGITSGLDIVQPRTIPWSLLLSPQNVDYIYLGQGRKMNPDYIPPWHIRLMQKTIDILRSDGIIQRNMRNVLSWFRIPDLKVGRSLLARYAGGTLNPKHSEGTLTGSSALQLVMLSDSMQDILKKRKMYEDVFSMYYDKESIDRLKYALNPPNQRYPNISRSSIIYAVGKAIKSRDQNIKSRDQNIKSRDQNIKSRDQNIKSHAHNIRFKDKMYRDLAEILHIIDEDAIWSSLDKQFHLKLRQVLALMLKLDPTYHALLLKPVDFREKLVMLACEIGMKESGLLTNYHKSFHKPKALQTLGARLEKSRRTAEFLESLDDVLDANQKAKLYDDFLNELPLQAQSTFRKIWNDSDLEPINPNVEYAADEIRERYSAIWDQLPDKFKLFKLMGVRPPLVMREPLKRQILRDVSSKLSRLYEQCHRNVYTQLEEITQLEEATQSKEEIRSDQPLTLRAGKGQGTINKEDLALLLTKITSKMLEFDSEKLAETAAKDTERIKEQKRNAIRPLMGALNSDDSSKPEVGQVTISQVLNNKVKWNQASFPAMSDMLDWHMVDPDFSTAMDTDIPYSSSDFSNKARVWALGKKSNLHISGLEPRRHFSKKVIKQKTALIQMQKLLHKFERLQLTFEKTLEEITATQVARDDQQEKSQDQSKRMQVEQEKHIVHTPQPKKNPPQGHILPFTYDLRPQGDIDTDQKDDWILPDPDLWTTDQATYMPKRQSKGFRIIKKPRAQKQEQGTELYFVRSSYEELTILIDALRARIQTLAFQTENVKAVNPAHSKQDMIRTITGYLEQATEPPALHSLDAVVIADLLEKLPLFPWSIREDVFLILKAEQASRTAPMSKKFQNQLLEKIEETVIVKREETLQKSQQASLAAEPSKESEANQEKIISLKSSEVLHSDQEPVKEMKPDFKEMMKELKRGWKEVKRDAFEVLFQIGPQAFVEFVDPKLFIDRKNMPIDFNNTSVDGIAAVFGVPSFSFEEIKQEQMQYLIDYERLPLKTLISLLHEEMISAAEVADDLTPSEKKLIVSSIEEEEEYLARLSSIRVQRQKPEADLIEQTKRVIIGLFTQDKPEPTLERKVPTSMQDEQFWEELFESWNKDEQFWEELFELWNSMPLPILNSIHFRWTERQAEGHSMQKLVERWFGQEGARGLHEQRFYGLLRRSSEKINPWKNALHPWLYGRAGQIFVRRNTIPLYARRHLNKKQVRKRTQATSKPLIGTEKRMGPWVHVRLNQQACNVESFFEPSNFEFELEQEGLFEPDKKKLILDTPGFLRSFLSFEKWVQANEIRRQNPVPLVSGSKIGKESWKKLSRLDTRFNQISRYRSKIARAQVAARKNKSKRLSCAEDKRLRMSPSGNPRLAKQDREYLNEQNLQLRLADYKHMKRVYEFFNEMWKIRKDHDFIKFNTPDLDSDVDLIWQVPLDPYGSNLDTRQIRNWGERRLQDAYDTGLGTSSQTRPLHPIFLQPIDDSENAMPKNREIEAKKNKRRALRLKLARIKFPAWVPNHVIDELLPPIIGRNLKYTGIEFAVTGYFAPKRLDFNRLRGYLNFRRGAKYRRPAPIFDMFQLPLSYRLERFKQKREGIFDFITGEGIFDFTNPSLREEKSSNSTRPFSLREEEEESSNFTRPFSLREEESSGFFLNRKRWYGGYKKIGSKEDKGSPKNKVLTKSPLAKLPKKPTSVLVKLPKKPKSALVKLPKMTKSEFLRKSAQRVESALRKRAKMALAREDLPPTSTRSRYMSEVMYRSSIILEHTLQNKLRNLKRRWWLLHTNPFPNVDSISKEKLQQRLVSMMAILQVDRSLVGEMVASAYPANLPISSSFAVSLLNSSAPRQAFHTNLHRTSVLQARARYFRDPLVVSINEPSDLGSHRRWQTKLQWRHSKDALKLNQKVTKKKKKHATTFRPLWWLRLGKEPQFCQMSSEESFVWYQMMLSKNPMKIKLSRRKPTVIVNPNRLRSHQRSTRLLHYLHIHKDWSQQPIPLDPLVNLERKDLDLGVWLHPKPRVHQLGPNSYARQRLEPAWLSHSSKRSLMQKFFKKNMLSAHQKKVHTYYVKKYKEAVKKESKPELNRLEALHSRFIRNGMAIKNRQLLLYSMAERPTRGITKRTLYIGVDRIKNIKIVKLLDSKYQQLRFDFSERMFGKTTWQITSKYGKPWLLAYRIWFFLLKVNLITFVLVPIIRRLLYRYAVYRKWIQNFVWSITYLDRKGENNRRSLKDVVALNPHLEKEFLTLIHTLRRGESQATKRVWVWSEFRKGHKVLWPWESLLWRRPLPYHAGVILVGPPGTGKTLLGQALAGSANVRFIGMTSSEFVFQGIKAGPTNIHHLFLYARSNAPCVLFIDEIDTLTTVRTGRALEQNILPTTVGTYRDLRFSRWRPGLARRRKKAAGDFWSLNNPFWSPDPLTESVYFERALNVEIDHVEGIDIGARRFKSDRFTSRGPSALTIQMLSEIDGCYKKSKVFLMGSTNRITKIDAAVTRPGRIDRIIHLTRPDNAQRLETLKHYTDYSEGQEMLFPMRNFNIYELHVMTFGMTPADISTLVNESKLYSVLQQIRIEMKLGRLLGSSFPHGHTTQSLERGIDIVTSVLSSDSRDQASEGNLNLYQPFLWSAMAYYRAASAVVINYLPPFFFVGATLFTQQPRTRKHLPIYDKVDIEAHSERFDATLCKIAVLSHLSGIASKFLLMQRRSMDATGLAWLDLHHTWDLELATAYAYKIVDQWALFDPYVGLSRVMLGSKTNVNMGMEKRAFRILKFFSWSPRMQKASRLGRKFKLRESTVFQQNYSFEIESGEETYIADMPIWWDSYVWSASRKRKEDSMQTRFLPLWKRGTRRRYTNHEWVNPFFYQSGYGLRTWNQQSMYLDPRDSQMTHVMRAGFEVVWRLLEDHRALLDQCALIILLKGKLRAKELAKFMVPFKVVREYYFQDYNLNPELEFEPLRRQSQYAPRRLERSWRSESNRFVGARQARIVRPKHTPLWVPPTSKSKSIKRNPDMIPRYLDSMRAQLQSINQDLDQVIISLEQLVPGFTFDNPKSNTIPLLDIASIEVLKTRLGVTLGLPEPSYCRKTHSLPPPDDFFNEVLPPLDPSTTPAKQLEHIAVQVAYSMALVPLVETVQSWILRWSRQEMHVFDLFWMLIPLDANWNLTSNKELPTAMTVHQVLCMEPERYSWFLMSKPDDILWGQDVPHERIQAWTQFCQNVKVNMDNRLTERNLTSGSDFLNDLVQREFPALSFENPEGMSQDIAMDMLDLADGWLRVSRRHQAIVYSLSENVDSLNLDEADPLRDTLKRIVLTEKEFVESIPTLRTDMCDHTRYVLRQYTLAVSTGRKICSYAANRFYYLEDARQLPLQND